MGQPVVLPKFELPGDKPHWAVRLAWVTGAALLVSVLVLGGVILHHRSLEAKVELARQEVIAKAKAEAQAKLDAIAAAVAAARAAKEAELAAAKQKQAERAVPANTVASVAESSDLGGAARSGGRVRHGHAGHGSKGLHVAAADKAAPAKSDDPTGKKAARANSAKNDVIDDLLAKMK
jgi:multidrug efflux pump subunit AcrA (membrane-fusion protein)